MIIGALSIRRRISMWINIPSSAQPIGTRTTASQNGSLKPTTMETVESAATARISPCAKLITRMTPKIRFNPHAINA
jgi:hypothetical protein